MSPFAIVIMSVVLLTAAILGVKNLLSPESRKQPEQTAASQASSPEDIKALIDKIGMHILINRSESPTVATVQDADMLRSQNPQFYKDAQNGDRLVIWSDKAILYSPARDVLLAVLPVSLPAAAVEHATGTAAFSASSSEQASEQATIEVRNGSGIPGLGRAMAEKLKAAGLDVLPATDAKVKTYATTVIVKANDKPLPITLEALIEVTGASVVPAPPVEGAIKGDFLVIVGADAKK